MLPGIIARSHLHLDPTDREDSGDDVEEHARDMILTKEQLDKIKKETETNNRLDDDDVKEHAGDMILTKEQLDKIKKETEASNRLDRNDETMIDDMIFTPEQMAIINGEKDPEDRGIAPDWAKHWDFKDDNQPGMVIVPYKLSSSFSYDEKQWIRKALKEIEDVSCIRYYEISYSNPYDHYIDVKPDDGCSSYVGKVSYPSCKECYNKNQPLRLYFKKGNPEQSCAYGIGTVIHEFLHALGFSHEHSRHDRDSYIDLKPTKYTNDCDNTNYKILGSDEVVHYDVSYDYCSVLHYGEYTQCKITPKSWKTVSCTIKGQPVTEIGQRIGLSDKDIEEINKRYKCGNTGGGSGGGSSGGGSGGSGTNDCTNKYTYSCAEDYEYKCKYDSWMKENCAKLCGEC